MADYGVAGYATGIMEKELEASKTELEMIETETPQVLETLHKMWKEKASDHVDQRMRDLKEKLDGATERLLRRKRRPIGEEDPRFDEQKGSLEQRMCNRGALIERRLRKTTTERDVWIRNRWTEWRNDYLIELRRLNTSSEQKERLSGFFCVEDLELIFSSDDDQEKCSENIGSSDREEVIKSPTRETTSPTEHRQDIKRGDEYGRDESETGDNRTQAIVVRPSQTNASPESSEAGAVKERRPRQDDTRSAVIEVAPTETTMMPSVQCKKERRAQQMLLTPKYFNRSMETGRRPSSAADSGEMDGRNTRVSTETIPPVNQERLRILRNKTNWGVGEMRVTMLEIAILCYRTGKTATRATWMSIIDGTSNLNFLARYEDCDVFNTTRQVVRSMQFTLGRFMKWAGYRPPIHYQGKWYAVGCRHPVAAGFFHAWCAPCFARKLTELGIADLPCRRQNERRQLCCEPCRHAPAVDRQAWYDALGKVSCRPDTPARQRSKKKLPSDVN